MQSFILGAICMGFWVGGLFFLHFWRQTKDRLFLIFGLAFWLLAAGRLFLALTDADAEDVTETRAYIYLIRLAAFVFIIFAIIDKNRGARQS